MINLEDIFTQCFNEIIEGQYTTILTDSKVDVQYNAIEALGETRKTMWYEWCEDNDKLYLVDGIFEHILKPKTPIDLKGYNDEDVIFMISPETKRLKGHTVPSIKANKSDTELLEGYKEKLLKWIEEGKSKAQESHDDLFE